MIDERWGINERGRKECCWICKKEKEELKNQETTQKKINELLVQRYSNSISVQKVKDKIEEYKNMLKTCNKAKDIDRIKAINERILELQELLEGRK